MNRMTWRLFSELYRRLVKSPRHRRMVASRCTGAVYLHETWFRVIFSKNSEAFSDWLLFQRMERV